MMIDNNWINNLKVGDEVIVYSTTSSRIEKVTAINKVTINVNGVLYNKTNGRERGGDTWFAWHIMEATEDRVAEVKLECARRYLRRTLDNLDVDKLSMEQINNILTAIKI